MYFRFYVLRVTCMIGIIPLLADIAVSVFVGDLDLVKIFFIIYLLIKNVGTIASVSNLGFAYL